MASQHRVEITYGRDLVGELKALLGERRFALVTSPSMRSNGRVDALLSAFGTQVSSCFSSVSPNPSFEAVAICAQQVTRDCEVVVGLGGGSVLDTAKAVAAIAHEADPEAWLVRHVRDATAYPASFSPLPVIAVPTTAGTGSEVTMWGSLWDSSSLRKFSISDERLYPEHALVIPSLTHSLPYDQSLFPALDAISHSLEAMWSRNGSEAADAHARKALGSLMAMLDDEYCVTYSREDVRAIVQEASVSAGLAMSLARTSLAHSISYPITAHLGMPHGLACSFTLPEIIRANAEVAPERMKIVARALGHDSAEACSNRLYDLLRALEIPRYLKKYLPSRAPLEALRGEFITKGKASNNLGPSTEAAAWEILNRALDRLEVAK